MEELSWPHVQQYVEQLVAAREPEMVAMEEHARKVGFPIIGPACGQLCYQLARTLGARNVFELGSGYGYSTAWFAKAVRDNGGGVVHHVVWDEKLSLQARSHLEKLGLDSVVRFEVGEAVHALKHAQGPFDIVFNDIDKDGYPDSLPVIGKQLRVGGVLIIDNMLWHGRIFDDSDQRPATVGVREFTRRICADRSWVLSLVPIRDGMIVATKVAA